MNEDVERFLDECRADALFQNIPNGVDRIEDLLTKFYHEADESPVWQELWDSIRGIITGKAPLIERFEELLLLLLSVRALWDLRRRRAPGLAGGRRPVPTWNRQCGFEVHTV